MDKGGHWVFGSDQTETEVGSTWAINPYSFVHGYIAWGDGEVLGEKMVGVGHPAPAMDVAPPNAKRGWEKQLGMSLRCMSGEDEGMECRFSSTSVGGKRAVELLANAIAEQVDRDQSHPVPVVKLGKDSYQHKSYGKIYTPVFEIVEWVGLDGNGDDAAEEEVEEAPVAEAAPARRRRV